MVGEKLGSYRIEGTLGVGAMGVVYKATHETTGRPAAVKVVNGEIARRGKGYERFQREAEILQQFRHPNIVRFMAVGKYKGTSYFAMEFVAGQTLEAFLLERGPMPWAEVADYGAQICEALHYAHEHGVVHRDLKPSNLMVSDDGKIKLTDFGIAKDLDATALTATGRTLGTAAYMAPEQIRGTPEVSHKTDLYALGVVLYQMLTGRLPFEGSTAVVLMHAHLNAPVPRPSGKLAEIPRALDDLVTQLMAKDPAERPWDAAAVAHTLATVRDKAGKGETVKMVWPSASDDPELATRADRASSKPKKKKSGKGRTGSGSGTTAAAEEGGARRLETAGIVLALAAMLTFAGYWLWPPSAQYYYNQAARLMASEKRTDWMTARDEYLDPLDKKYPDNPYKATTRGWRDKLLLSEVEGRARTLASGVNTRLNQPQNANEERFVEFNTRVEAALKQKDEALASRNWGEMAAQLRADDEAERPWFLLAKQRSDELSKGIAKRQQMVVRLMTEAQEAEIAGKTVQAQALRNEVLSKFGEFADVKELLGLPAPGAAVPPGVRPEATPPNHEPSPAATPR